MKRSVLLFIFFVLVLPSPTYGQRCGKKCGVVRWPVKTLTDTTIKHIDPAPKSKTVDWLVRQTKPEKRPQQTRLNGLEWITFKVKAVLVGYKKSPDDNDFHVVIRDLNKRSTMIVEFKDPSCSAVCSSRYLDEMSAAREAFLNSPAVLERGKPTSKYKKLKKRVVVELIGVGFWDFIHGQIGVAKNGIEIHPVLSYKEIE